MAKKPSQSTPGPRTPQRGRNVPESSLPTPLAEGGMGRSSAPRSAADSELDEMESDLSAGSTVEDDAGEPEEREDGASGDAEAPAVGAARPAKARGFGSAEWAALGGFTLLALIGGALFMKFLYAHPAPTRGKGLPSRFDLPLSGAAVKLSGAESGWGDRLDENKARPEEKVLPTIELTLDAGHASTGFVRVEFVDSEDRIRGDVMTVALEGGRFKDSGRGEIVEDGGLKARLTGTVGFRSPALFASYLGGDEPRWSVRVKEGPDSSDGPWTELGAALIANKKQ